MTTRSCSICADSQRRERQRRRFSGSRDEWTVDKNLDMIIQRIQRCWLFEMVAFPSRIPSHCKALIYPLLNDDYETYDDRALNLPICLMPSPVLRQYVAPNVVLHNQIKFWTYWWRTAKKVSVRILEVRDRLTIVRRQYDKTWYSLMDRMKAVIRDGLFSGCLNRCSGSGWSQYSSSHSTGRSTSKL